MLVTLAAVIRTSLAAIALGLYTLLFASAAILTWPFSPSGAIVQWLARWWAWSTLKVCGARLEVEGLERVDRSGTYVFTSNHLSTFDIVALLFLQPTSCFRMMAKKSLFMIPFFGLAMLAGGFIPVDRRNRKNALRSTQKALRKIQGGMSVVVYPEGTRSRTGKLLPFKTGGFLLAIRAGVPVVPVTVIGSHLLQPPDHVYVRPGTFRVVFHDPIPTRHLQERDRGTLATEARCVIARRLFEAGQLDEEELRAVLATRADTPSAPTPVETARSS